MLRQFGKVAPAEAAFLASGSCVDGLLDFEELAQIARADHADFADFDERQRSVAHEVEAGSDKGPR